MQFLANTSKKLAVTVVAMILVALRDTLDLSPDQVEALMVLAGAYVVGQGIADHGKEAEKIKKKQK